MLYEYALEPDLLSNWKDFRYFTEKFDIAQGRLISRYPKRWKKIVYDSLANCGEIERKRIEEGLLQIDARMLKRHHSWERQQDWLANAEAEHERRPFRAIVARLNARQQDFVLEGDNLTDNHPLWKGNTSPIVPRTVQEMAACVALLLRASKEILFIDPHFGPENARHRRPLEAFLAAILEQRCDEPPKKVEVHLSAKSESKFFEDECKRRLPNIVPNGIKVRLVRWQQRDGGEKLHNRYILTDRGGVGLGVGLDDGTPGETDEFKFFDDAVRERRWKQFTSEPAFDFVDDLIVEGKLIDKKTP